MYFLFFKTSNNKIKFYTETSENQCFRPNQWASFFYISGNWNMTRPEAADEVSGRIIFFNMFFDWQNIQSVCFGHCHACFPVGTIIFTWISSPLILATSSGYLTLSYCTITQLPMMILCTQSGIWSAIWPGGNGDGHDILLYFRIIAVSNMTI